MSLPPFSLRVHALTFNVHGIDATSQIAKDLVAGMVDLTNGEDKDDADQHGHVLFLALQEARPDGSLLWPPLSPLWPLLVDIESQGTRPFGIVCATVTALLTLYVALFARVLGLPLIMVAPWIVSREKGAIVAQTWANAVARELELDGATAAKCLTSTQRVSRTTTLLACESFGSGLVSLVFYRGGTRTGDSRAPLLTTTTSTTTTLATGWHGLANKGAIFTRLQFNSNHSRTCITLINAHLPAHAGYANRVARNNALERIVEVAATTTSPSRLTIVAGDLNYRLTKEGINMRRFNEVVNDAENMEAAIPTLIAMDELSMELAAAPTWLFGYREASRVAFAPTYKLKVMREEAKDDHNVNDDAVTFWHDRYDLTKRVPAWCDRVLYHSPASTTTFRVRSYRALAHVHGSDHVPVVMHADVGLQAWEDASETITKAPPVIHASTFAVVVSLLLPLLYALAVSFVLTRVVLWSTWRVVANMPTLY